MTKMLLPDSPPWWAYVLIGLGCLVAGVLSWSEIFPSKLETQFKVHEASPAHGIAEMKSKQAEMYTNQKVIMRDIKYIKENIR